MYHEPESSQKYIKQYSYWAEIEAIKDVNGVERLGTIKITKGGPTNWSLADQYTYISVQFFDAGDILRNNRITVQDQIRTIITIAAEIELSDNKEYTYKLLDASQRSVDEQFFPHKGKEIFGQVMSEYDNSYLGVNIGFLLLVGVINKDIAKILRKGDWIKFRFNGWARAMIFGWRERVEEPDKKDRSIINVKYIDREFK